MMMGLVGKVVLNNLMGWKIDGWLNGLVQLLGNYSEIERFFLFGYHFNFSFKDT